MQRPEITNMSDERLQEWLESLPAAAYTCDGEGRLTAFNDRALKLWGSTPQLKSEAHRYFGPCEVLFENGAVLPPEEGFMARVLRSGNDCSECEITFRKAGGEMVHALVNASALRDGMGQLVGGIGIVIDLGKQHAARVRLEEEIDVYRKTEGLIHESNDRHDHLLMHFLHEDIAQQLTGIALLGGILQKNLTLEAHPLSLKAGELSRLTSQCMTTASSLAKGVYPLDIEVGGLIVALEALALRTESHLKISCRVESDSDFHFVEQDAIHIYRIAEIGILRAIQNFGSKRVVVACHGSGDGPRIEISHYVEDQKRIPWSSSWVGIDLLNSRARLIGASIELMEEPGKCSSLVCRLRETR
ncbi:MAG: PAS domain-containing protein [Chthoniobacteraceae bacterium]